jgi:hypothetical protein
VNAARVEAHATAFVEIASQLASMKARVSDSLSRARTSAFWTARPRRSRSLRVRRARAPSRWGRPYTSGATRRRWSRRRHVQRFEAALVQDTASERDELASPQVRRGPRGPMLLLGRAGPSQALSVAIAPGSLARRDCSLHNDNRTMRPMGGRYGTLSPKVAHASKPAFVALTGAGSSRAGASSLVCRSSRASSSRSLYVAAALVTWLGETIVTFAGPAVRPRCSGGARATPRSRRGSRVASRLPLARMRGDPLVSFKSLTQQAARSQ